MFLDFLLLHSGPQCKVYLFRVLVLKGLVGLHKPFNFSFFIVTCWGIDLDYCDIERFAMEMNRDDSIVFQIASSLCILDSFR